MQTISENSNGPVHSKTAPPRRGGGHPAGFAPGASRARKPFEHRDLGGVCRKLMFFEGAPNRAVPFGSTRDGGDTLGDLERASRARLRPCYSSNRPHTESHLAGDPVD
jgi:hypothetical protein